MKIQMNKNQWILAVSIIAIVGLWAAKSIFQKSDSTKKSTASIEGNPYWTCPMHPQIHLDHDGECPICHMKLVKIKNSTQPDKTQKSEVDKRSELNVNDTQLALIGIQKSKVEKMTLVAKIPVSGRVISSSTVAFQIYENDLRYVHSGLLFKGASSASLDEDISGKIDSVDSIVDPTSRTIRIVGSINKRPKGLLSETSFRGNVEIQLQDRLAIPESSVLHTGNGDLVYLFNESGSLTPKNVRLGIKTEGFYEVISGLNEGDEISSGPNFLIDSEAKIRGAND